MTDFSDLTTATRAVTDPQTSGADLAAITQAQPGLRAQVASHPNAYPGLLTWLAQFGDATTSQIAGARLQMPRKRSWLSGSVAAIVFILVIGVVLVALRPWQARVPELTKAQFAYMMLHNEDVFGLNGFGYTQADIYNRMESNSDFGATFWEQASQSACYRGIDGLQTAINGIVGLVDLGTDQGLVTGTVLFDTTAHATQFANALAQCGYPSGSPSGDTPQTVQAGVLLVGFGVDANGAMYEGTAQYGNVLFDNSSSSVPTWAGWQAQAATFKGLVDDAASH